MKYVIISAFRLFVLCILIQSSYGQFNISPIWPADLVRIHNRYSVDRLKALSSEKIAFRLREDEQHKLAIEKVGRLFSVDRCGFVKYLNTSLASDASRTFQLDVFLTKDAQYNSKFMSEEPYFVVVLEVVDDRGRKLSGEGRGSGFWYQRVGARKKQRELDEADSAQVAYMEAFLEAVAEINRQL